jgi:hypothetical protein
LRVPVAFSCAVTVHECLRRVAFSCAVTVHECLRRMAMMFEMWLLMLLPHSPCSTSPKWLLLFSGT